MSPEVSGVVTLYNEDGTVCEVVRRTVEALGALGRDWELILVDDGSTDATWAAVEGAHAADAERIRGIRLKRNFGQHPAMHAGLVRARGEVLVTMDGDLQNSPEDIPRLVAAVENGADVASGRRAARRDSWGRTVPSLLVNGMLRRFTGVALHVLAGFWPQPIQWIGLALGTVCTLAAFILGVYGVVYWITESNFPGPLFGGVGVIFVLGVQGFILALIGEYLGRIQRDVEGRPLYTIDREL